MSIYESDYFTTGPGRAMAHKGTGARSKRIARIRAAMPIVDELLEMAGRMNDIPWSRHDSDEGDLWLTVPISMNNREDDARDMSNFYTAQKCIDDVAAFGTDYRMDAWPGGVIHTLTVRADDALALREVQSLLSALESHPYLDDDDHSEREWEMNHPNDSECYADECSCDAAEKRREEEDHENGGQDYHVEGLSTFITPVEYDADGDWWCETCSTWWGFTDGERAAISAAIESNRARVDNAERERAGQLVVA